MNYNRRTERLSALLAEAEVDGLLVTAPANVRYLSGFSGSAGTLFVRAAGREGTHLFLSDFRYETQAAQEVAGCFERAFTSAREGEREPAEILAERLGRTARVAFEADHLTVAAQRRLEEQLRGVELVGLEGTVGKLRRTKEPEEVEAIAAAQAVADQALREVLERGLAGRSEREVAAELAFRMRRLGAEGESFPAIVASGAHGALPHAKAREVAIEKGTLVTIDWGAQLDGYCSDCTRTYAVGPPTGRAREIYGIVLAAQQRGLEALRPGADPAAVDRAAREVIEEAGYGSRFGHSLGHGVGLEIHEAPRLGPPRPQEQGQQVLAVGEVVTVEPGIYLPGELGVRIEELVVVGEPENRILTSLPRALTEVG